MFSCIERCAAEKSVDGSNILHSGLLRINSTLYDQSLVVARRTCQLLIPCFKDYCQATWLACKLIQVNLHTFLAKKDHYSGMSGICCPQATRQELLTDYSSLGYENYSVVKLRALFPSSHVEMVLAELGRACQPRSCVTGLASGKSSFD